MQRFSRRNVAPLGAVVIVNRKTRLRERLDPGGVSPGEISFLWQDALIVVRLDL